MAASIVPLASGSGNGIAIRMAPPPPQYTPPPADLGRTDSNNSMASKDSVECKGDIDAIPQVGVAGDQAGREDTEEQHHIGDRDPIFRVNLAKTGFACFCCVVIMGPLLGGIGYYIEEQTNLTDPPPPTPLEQQIANPTCTYIGDPTCNNVANIPQSVSTAYCPYFHNRAPRRQPQLQNCTMYRPNSCCLSEEIEQTFDGVQPLIFADDRCQYYQRTLMCFICSPAQAVFYKNETLNVCTEYCDRYYAACKDAYRGINKVSELYSTANAFCEDHQFTVTNSECFTQNSAGRSKLSSAAFIIPLGLMALQQSKSSKLLLVIALSLALLSGASAQESQDTGWTNLNGSIGNACPMTGQVAAPQLLPNCSWYRESACCTPSQVSSVFDDMEMARLQFVSGSADWQEQCSNHLTFMMCHFCSPYQANWYDTSTNKVKISDLFCDETYRLCQDALTYWDYTCTKEKCDTQLYTRLMDEFGELPKERVGNPKDYTASTKFCERQGFQVTPESYGSVANQSVFSLDETVYARSVYEEDDRGHFGMEYCNTDMKEFYDVGGCVGAAIPTRARSALGGALLTGLSIGFTQGSVRGAAVAFAVVAMLPVMTSATLLPATVVQWATELNTLTSNFVTTVLKGDDLQNTIDGHVFIDTTTDGQVKFDAVKTILSTFVTSKIEALNRIVDKATTLAAQSNTVEATTWSDADKWYPEFVYDPYFKGNTSRAYSNIKFPSETARDMIDDPAEKTKVLREIEWTAGLDEVFRANMDADAEMKWQYVGLESGLMRNYPSVNLGRDLSGSVPDYDPRFRPWYTGATSGPKDVVIVMDCSKSVLEGASEQIKKVTKRFLKTLSQQDYVSVICGRGSDRQLYESYGCGSYHSANCQRPVDSTPDELTCQPGKLVPATGTQLKTIEAKIDGAVMQGGSDFRNAFIMAQNLFLNGGGHGCNRVLIHIADGESKDDLKYWCDHCRRRSSSRRVSNELEDDSADLDTVAPPQLPTPGRRRAGKIKKRKGNETRRYMSSFFGSSFFVPPTMYEDMEHPGHTGFPRDGVPESLSSYITTLNSALGSNGWSYWAYNTDEFGDDLLAACTKPGGYCRLNDGFKDGDRVKTISANMRPYLNYMEQVSRSSDVSWSSVYLDAYGIGLLFTVSKAIFKDGVHVGVAATDVTVTDIETIISNEMDHEIDSFLIDGFGKAVAHPSLKPASELLASPMLVDITNLEMYQNAPTEFTAVATAMKAGQSGYVQVTDAPRFAFNGGFDDGVSWTAGHTNHYYYANIPGSDYSFGFNLADSDLSYKKIQASLTSPLIIYQKISEYPVYMPSVDVAVQIGVSSLYADNWPVAPGHVSVQFAGKSFCDPEAVLMNHTSEKNPGLEIIHTALNTNGAPPAGVGCSASTTNWLHTNALYDVWSAYPIQTAWLARVASDVASVPWTYYGTEHGAFLMFPGSRGPVDYDPTKRAWYRKTKADAKSSPHYSGGGAVLSSVYLDYFGTGKLISLSRAIYQKPPTCANAATTPKLPGCTCTEDHDCAVGRCYDTRSLGNLVCSSDTIMGVVSADLLYADWSSRVTTAMDSVTAQAEYRCGQSYVANIAAGEKTVKTQCYIVDDSAHLNWAPQFASLTDGDIKEYQSVGLGHFEGAVMLDLVKSGFFARQQFVNFQGDCAVEGVYTKEEHSWGLRRNANEQDRYAQSKGPFPRPARSSQCIEDVVHFKANNTILTAAGGSLSGTVSDACGGGTYHFTRVTSTNTYLLAIEKWSHNVKDEDGGMVFNFGCHIANRTQDSGSWKIINGSCADEEQDLSSLLTCPVKVSDVQSPECESQGGTSSVVPSALLCFFALCGIWFAACIQ